MLNLHDVQWFIDNDPFITDRQIELLLKDYNKEFTYHAQD